MTAPLAERAAVVTGASRGIGEAAARRLVADGASVVAVARDGDALARLAADLGERCHPLVADLSDPAGPGRVADAVRERFGALGALVNNAAYCPPAVRMEELPAAEWERTLRTNVTGPWQLACLLRPLMPRGAAIVNVTSTSGAYVSPGMAAYCASKAALESVTRSAALEWARDGIRVLALAPGKTDTRMVQPALAWDRRANRHPNPMRRIAAPAELAGVIAFLVSDAAAYMTGSTITVDGGELLWASRPSPE